MALSIAEFSEALASVVERSGASVVRVEGRRGHSSGVAWSATHVVTALHALDRRSEALAVGVEGAQRSARLAGADETTDLALLEVEGGGLTAATFDDGAALKVGHVVLALARPGQSVRASAGIVQALGRQPWRTPQGGQLDRYLESDAAHGPGFSGGPLVDHQGAVVGLSTTALVRGRSVAVGTPTLRRVVAALQAHGKVRQSYLGLSLQPLPLPRAVRELTGEEVGLLVAAVEPGGPGEQAGIAFGDTVLHLGDDSVLTLDDLYAYLRADRVGEQVPVKLFRHGKVDTVAVTLGARP